VEPTRGGRVTVQVHPKCKTGPYRTGILGQSDHLSWSPLSLRANCLEGDSVNCNFEQKGEIILDPLSKM
jgi:hypothetical protein